MMSSQGSKGAGSPLRDVSSWPQLEGRSKMSLLLLILARLISRSSPSRFKVTPIVEVVRTRQNFRKDEPRHWAESGDKGGLWVGRFVGYLRG